MVSKAQTDAGHLTHPSYRPDIDGLRAIAVLSVVGFHAFPNSIRGGFIGVDIFFVISGFLISTIIFESLRRDSFSFAAFYSRRIRRIFPALILVLLACGVAGWFELFADEYKQLGKHIAGGAGFVSNFVLWGESGYFDNDADTKPLLHLWSLGIEEQFYIFWPLILWLVHRKNLNFLTVTLLLAGASFALNIGGIHQKPVAVFYAPQTRFWELMIGSALAYVMLHNRASFSAIGKKINAWLAFAIYERPPKAESDFSRNILSLLGAGLIVAALCVIKKDGHFPGWGALLPTVGAALIISGGRQAWLNRAVLSNRILVWFGLISFPLYLWHWPLLSFARIVGGGEAPRSLRIGLVAASVLLAWLTYLLVERPVRYGSNGKMKTAVLLVVMLGIGCAGYGDYLKDGILSRDVAQKTQIFSHYNSLEGKTSEEFWGTATKCMADPDDTFLLFEKDGCAKTIYPGQRKVFMVGDSFSAYLGRTMKNFVVAKKYNFMQFSTAYCTPFSLKDKRQRCRDINQYVLGQIMDQKPDILVIYANYMLSASAPDNGEPGSYADFLLEKINEFKKEGVKKIIVVGMYPTWVDALPKLLLRDFVLKHRPVPVRTYENVNPLALEWDKKLRDLPYPEGVTYLSLKDLLCDPSGCLTMAGPDPGTDLITFDYGHFTTPGGTFIIEHLLLNHLD